MKGEDGGDEKEGGLGSGSGFEARGYAAFLQNAGIVVGVFSQGLHSGLVCDAHSGHGIRNRVDGHGIGNTVNGPGIGKGGGGKAGGWEICCFVVVLALGLVG